MNYIYEAISSNKLQYIGKQNYSGYMYYEYIYIYP